MGMNKNLGGGSWFSYEGVWRVRPLYTLCCSKNLSFQKYFSANESA